MYMQSTGEKDVWDFYPLPDDPTPEEREQWLKEAKEEQAQREDAKARAVLKEFKERFPGHIN